MAAMEEQDKTIDQMLRQLETLCGHWKPAGRDIRSCQEALRQCEARYQQLLSSVGDYVYRIPFKDGRPLPTVHGPGCIAVTGYSPEDFEADPDLWIRMVVEEDQDNVREQARRLLADPPRPPLEHRIRRKDGAIRWVRNTPMARYSPEGRLLSLEGIVQDISALRQEQEERLAQAMHFSRRLEDQGRLVMNSFQILSSILQLQMQSDPHSQAGRMLLADHRRVQVLAMTFQNYLAKDIPEEMRFSSLIRKLVDHLQVTCQNSAGIEWSLECQDTPWPQELAITAGLILSELLAVSLQYAFSDRSHSQIRIRSYRQEGQYVLQLQHDGIVSREPAHPPEEIQFGLRLSRLLCRFLKAELFVNTEAGTSYRLIFEENQGHDMQEQIPVPDGP